MVGQQRRPFRVFTVEQANATLPLVRAIVSDLVRLARDVSDRSERLSFLPTGREPLGRGDPYAEELVQVREELQRDHRRLQDYADELLELGVEPISAVEGLVDFPAVMDGRAGCFCWKLGEPEILFWHDVDAEYADRRCLTTGAPAGDDSVGAGRNC